MSTRLGFLKRHGLVMALVLMFLYTWTIDLANAGVLPFSIPFPVYLTLGWGFIFVSLLMTGLTLGREAARSLLRRYWRWRVGWLWYAAAILLGPLLVAGAVGATAGLRGAAPDFSNVLAHQIFGRDANLALLAAPFFLVDFITNGEEMGWRGYVLPRLQARWSALAASLILGVIWGLWHLPKFVNNFSLGGFALFMAHILAFAIILTWLYNNSNGSLLIVAISHACANTAGVFLPLAGPTASDNVSYIILVVLETAVACVIVIASGAANLSRSRARQKQE